MFDLISWLPKINNSCFLNCDYCMVTRELEFEKRNALPSTAMDLDLIKQMCEKSLGYNKWFFSFLGGEPLMNGKEYFRQMFEIIEEKSKQMFIPYTMRVTTNGLLLDDEWIELFKAYNCKIIVSYDGLGTGQKGSKKMHGLIRKYAKSIHVVQTVVCNENKNQLVDVYKEMEDLGVRYWSTQYEIYSNTEQHKEYAQASIDVFKYIDGLDKVKTSYFVYNDAKAMSKMKLASLNSGDFMNNRLVSDYVVEHDGGLRNALNARESNYAHYGNLSDYDHINDILFTDTMKTVLKDYVNAIKAFGELEKVSLLTRGGGYAGDRFGIRPEGAPHVPKLTCYKLLLEYFGMDLN